MLALMALASAGCSHGIDQPGAIGTHIDDWRDEIIYQILVDRFDNGDPSNDSADGVDPSAADLSRMQGGDWAGVTRRLGYIERLGATAIWISPLVSNVPRTEREDGYHGYWAADFTKPNPRFGSLEEIQVLVREAHARGIKVIVDIVTNHTGRVFYYDFNHNGQPDGRGELEPRYSARPYDPSTVAWLTEPPRLFRGRASSTAGVEPFTLDARHFHRRGQTTDHQDQLQKEMGDFPTGLRDLATERSDVLEALVDTYARWVELTDVDGFRIDVVPHVPHRFWSRFSRQLRRRLSAIGKHRFLLVGEVFTGDATRLASYTREGELDSVFDFTLKFGLIDGVILDGRAPSTAVAALETNRGLYPPVPHPEGAGLTPWQARVSFADNHDVRRVRGEIDDPFVSELAMTAVFTVDAIPAVYYGTEQELASPGDGHASREVLWHSGFGEDTQAFALISHLAAIRRGSKALRRGKLVVRYASTRSARQGGYDAGMIAWERVADGERVLIVLNTNPLKTSLANIATGFSTGDTLRDLLREGKQRWLVDREGKLQVKLPPRRALILTRLE